MQTSEVFGIAIAVLAGLVMGTSPWPLKRMHKFQYEHFALVSMFVALVIIPWTVVWIFCPYAVRALRTLDPWVLVQSNLFSLGFGLAQVLAMLCFVRIGVSLTYGILTAAGASVGVVIPLVLKGSGPFAAAPDLFSPAGLTVIAGVGIMLVGIFLATLAGFGRESRQTKSRGPSGRLVIGLLMAFVAGVLSAGLLFVFVYSAGPIKQAMQAHGAPELAADLSVWAIGLFGAALVNIFYPIYLLATKRSWRVFFEAPGDWVLSVFYGVQFFSAIALMGEGAILLKQLGPSVGWGTQQGMQMVGGHLLGYLAGEWRGVSGKPRLQIWMAVGVLVVAVAVLAYSKTFS